MSTPDLTTREGLARLEARLADLEERLSTVVASKAEAAEVGGNQWHDNASFEEAERTERLLRRQISDLKARMARLTVVDERPPSADSVGIGSRVVVQYDDGTAREFHIRGQGESDPEAGVIAYDTPLAQAIMGATVGTVATFIVGRRVHRVSVESIR